MLDGRQLRRRLRSLGSKLRRRVDPENVLAAVWAMRALSKLRVELAAKGTAAIVQEPRRASPSGLRGVAAVLRTRGATCLERSLVVQRWLAATGARHDVVIGVSAPGEDFAAHAWLAGYGNDPEAMRYKELMRLPPPEAS